MSPTMEYLSQRDLVAPSQDQDQSTLTAQRHFDVYAPYGDLRWLETLRASIAKIANLQDNWDSYGASAISMDLLKSSLDLLSNVIGPKDPLPSIVPTVTGGIQFEWHVNGVDLEVEIESLGQVKVYYEHGNKVEEWEKNLFAAVPGLRAYTRELNSRTTR